VGVLGAGTLLGGACATPGARSPAPSPASAIVGVEPIAYVDGRPVTLADLGPTLLEAAGRTALDEYVLDLAVEREARRLGVGVTPADLERERTLFLESITDAGVAAGPAAAEDLLARVRRSRGLGPDRFERLLRRSALLRAMVRDDATVTDEMIDLAHRIEHGERRAARIITTPTLAEAQRAADALAAGVDFAEAAARFSTDPSALRGGLIDPISPHDPSYPEALRRALAAAEPGEIVGPVAVDAGFALARLDRVIPPDGVTREESRGPIARRLRLQEERRLMADLARRLAGRVTVTVRDDSLRAGR